MQKAAKCHGIQRCWLVMRAAELKCPIEIQFWPSPCFQLRFSHIKTGRKNLRSRDDAGFEHVCVVHVLSLAHTHHLSKTWQDL